MTEPIHWHLASPASFSTLQGSWDYQPSPSSWQVKALRARARLLRRDAAPPSWILSRPVPTSRWNCLFLYLPTGELDVDQLQIVARVRRLAGRMLIVFASLDATVPTELDVADALIWKGLSGFDFSAYALALSAVATYSPGAMVYVQNDSVLGPFADIDAMLAMSPWDLTGFYASLAIENHLSSYAFAVRAVTPDRVRALSTVMLDQGAYHGFNEVVLMQETRFARIASRSMRVGSFLYAPVITPEWPLRKVIANRLSSGRIARETVDLSGNLLASFPLQMLDVGHPFVKRSLFGKFGPIADGPALRRRLEGFGWSMPPDGDRSG